MCACMYVRVRVCEYGLCMYVCVYVCVYACVCVWLYVCLLSSVYDVTIRPQSHCAALILFAHTLKISHNISVIAIILTREVSVPIQSEFEVKCHQPSATVQSHSGRAQD